MTVRRQAIALLVIVSTVPVAATALVVSIHPALAIAVAAVAFAVGSWLTERWLGRLRGLVRATTDVAAGKRDVEVPRGGADELAALGRALTELIGVIDMATFRLEAKVADRTQALLAANEMLRRHRMALAGQRDQLQQKNLEVERADRMKSEFLANMSHELRTPLNSVIGFADLLQVTARDRLTDEETDFLRDIVQAGQHLLHIINDILDLARIESGQVRLELQEVRPEAVVDGARAILLAQARARRIEIEVAGGSDRAVRADADRLRQVLLNLMANAIKFSPEGSTVQVRVGERNGGIAFEVIDRGPGISAEVAARLFQPFVQGETGLAKKHQGTGLGLSISKKLVDLHGGRIELDSQVGAGSTFRVVLPAA
jgi:signal transduction histidine kinase